MSNEIFVSDQLTDSEIEEREIHESNVDNAIKTIEVAGQIGDASLRVLRDKRLYRSTHNTFEDYCQERFGITRNYVNRRLVFAQILEGLVPRGTKVLPATERQARPLSKLETPEQKAEAWSNAQESTGKEQPSAKEVDKAVKELQNALTTTQARAEEWRQQYLGERDNKRQLELEVEKLKASPEVVYSAPEDYERIKEELAKATQELTRINGQIEIATNAKVRTILADRQNELDALEENKRQLEKSVNDYREEIKRINGPMLEMRRQREEIEKVQQALAGLAAAITMFDCPPNNETASCWNKLAENLDDAARAARLFAANNKEDQAA